MQITGDGGELGGSEGFLVCKITIESQALDFSVPNRKRFDYGSRRICSFTGRTESAGQKKYVDTYAPYRMARRAKSQRMSHRHWLTNPQLLHKWRVVPARAEIAIRRVKWWQAMTEHNHAHLQTMAAIWGQLPDEAQTLTAEGFLAPTANLYAVAFSDDLHLFEELSGTEDFFEIWEEKHLSVVSVFDDEDVRDAFQRTDFKLMRTKAFSDRKLWDNLMERTTPRFDREGTERYVFELSGDQGRCGMIFTN